MKRWTIARGLAWAWASAAVIILTAGIARAAECPNKFGDAKDVAVSGASQGEAEKAYKKQILADEGDAKTECKTHKCTEAKKSCRPVFAKSEMTCTESKDPQHPGWNCTGTFRSGCFCLTDGEILRGAAETPVTAPKPTETSTACPNKFGDQKDAAGVGDSDAKAKTGLEDKIKEYVDNAVKECSDKKCTDAKHRCRMYYTTTKRDCSQSKNKEFPGFLCTSKFRAGCFCLGAAENLP